MSKRKAKITRKNITPEQFCDWFLAYTESEREEKPDEKVMRMNKTTLGWLLIYARLHWDDLYQTRIGNGNEWYYASNLGDITETYDKYKPKKTLKLDHDLDFNDYSDSLNKHFVKLWNTYKDDLTGNKKKHQ